MYYFKYSSIFATRFSPFVELYADETQDSFLIDLSVSERADSTKNRTREPETLADLFDRWPDLRELNTLAERLVDMEAVEKHCVDYLDAITFDIARGATLATGDHAHAFWEAFILCRTLTLLDLQQIAKARPDAYRPRLSVTQLVEFISSCSAQVRTNPL